LQRLLRVADAQVIRIPDPNRTVDYRVEIGTEYRLCQYGNAEDELVITPSPDTELSDLPSAVCWLRFRAAVNVREGPDTTYDILDVATPDDQFPITGRTLDGHWWRVDDDGETGWVSAQITNTLLAGECTSVPVVASP
jgi:SH3-like domain-containing protein